jgi:hypothetical protein
MEVSDVKFIEIASGDFLYSNIHNILLQTYALAANVSILYIPNWLVTSRRIIDKQSKLGFHLIPPKSKADPLLKNRSVHNYFFFVLQ